MEVNFPNLPMQAELVEAGEELVTESKQEVQSASFVTGGERLTAKKMPVQDAPEAPMPQSVRSDELLGSGRLLLPPGLQKQLQSSDAPAQLPVVSGNEGGLPPSAFDKNPKGGNPPGIGKGHDKGHGFGGVAPGIDPGVDPGTGIEPPKDLPIPIDLPSPPVLQPPSDGRQIPSPPVVVGSDPVDTPSTPVNTPAQEQPAPKPVASDGRLPTELPVTREPGKRADNPARAPIGEPARGIEPRSLEPRSIAEVVTSTTSRFHTVPVGQSLEQVAAEFSIDVHSLLEANPHLLKDPLLFAGQRLRVPRNLQPQAEKTHFGAPRVDQNLYAALKTPVNLSVQPPVALPTEPMNHTEPMHSKGPMGFEERPQLELEQTAMVLEEPTTRSTGSLKKPVQIVRPEVLEEELPKVQGRGTAREERVSEQKTVKQQENLTPGLGAHTTVRREEDADDTASVRKRRPNLSIPAPFDEWADYIYDSAEKYMLDPALLAAVIWRESGGRNIVGKDGHGFGLMQIDDRQHRAWLSQNDGLDPELNIDFGASLLRKYTDYFGGRASHALAAFDCGLDAVEEALVLGKSVDYFTREGNYSLSVLTQMEYFKRFF